MLRMSGRPRLIVSDKADRSIGATPKGGLDLGAKVHHRTRSPCREQSPFGIAGTVSSASRGGRLGDFP